MNVPPTVRKDGGGGLLPLTIEGKRGGKGAKPSTDLSGGRRKKSDRSRRSFAGRKTRLHRITEERRERLGHLRWKKVKGSEKKEV